MNKETIKRIVLGLLVVLFVYIWWDVVAIFSSGETPVAIDRIHSGSESRETIKTASIEYQPPKINPFARTTNTKPTNKPVRTNSPTIKPALSQTHILTGILRRGQQSQAVIKLPSGTSTILSLGDTLSDWRLDKIERELVILRRDKQLDSLFLQTSQR